MSIDVTNPSGRPFDAMPLLQMEWFHRDRVIEHASDYLDLSEIATVDPRVVPTEVTPQGLLESAAGRLEGIDAQIVGAMGAVEARRVEAANYSSQMAHLQELQTALSAAGKTGSDRMRLGDIEIQLPNGETMSAVRYIRENGLEDLLELSDDFDSDTKIGPEVQSAIDQARTQHNQVNSRIEQDMLFIQELVQQRGQVIELTTKLLDALHQSQKAVLANIGR